MHVWVLNELRYFITFFPDCTEEFFILQISSFSRLSGIILFFSFGTVFIASLRYNIYTNPKEAEFMESKKLSTKKIVLTALMAALTVIGSALRITLPVSIMGTTAFHLGNIFCALSGILLGPGLGGLAAGLGSAIYDMLNPAYIDECLITFVMKGAYGLVTGLIVWSGKNHDSYRKLTFATLAGAITYAVLYMAKNYFKGILIQGLVPVASAIALLDKVPATIFNAVVAVIFAPILASAIRTALKKNHITLE